MPTPESPLPYGTRECRGHWHVTAGGEDLFIPRLGNELDAGTAWSESAKLNIDWLQAEVGRLTAENERLRGGLKEIANRPTTLDEVGIGQHNIGMAESDAYAEIIDTARRTLEPGPNKNVVNDG